jgi:hypothetical protein
MKKWLESYNTRVVKQFRSIREKDWSEIERCFVNGDYTALAPKYDPYTNETLLYENRQPVSITFMYKEHEDRNYSLTDIFLHSHIKYLGDFLPSLIDYVIKAEINIDYKAFIHLDGVGIFCMDRILPSEMVFTILDRIIERNKANDVLNIVECVKYHFTLIEEESVIALRKHIKKEDDFDINKIILSENFVILINALNSLYSALMS